MTYFLSDTYDKPKLVENKLLKKIVINQKNQECIEQKVLYKIIEYITINYQIILIILTIIIGLYWRYNETQKKKYITFSDSDSDL